MALERWAAPAAATLTALAVLAGGCANRGGPPEGHDAAAGKPGAAFPVTVEAANGSVTVPSRPQRIVSISPTATEMLFAIGAGDQVVAVDGHSNYPPRAPQTKLSAYQPNLEAIAGYRPDLVVVSDTSPSDVVPGLTKLGITVVREPSPTRLRGVYDQIRDLGAATGHRERATKVAQQVRSRLRDLFASAPEGRGLSVFHELSPDLYSASSRTFIGRIYARLGLTNIADEAAEKSGDRYPQLSPEYVVSADPDLIVLADRGCCGVTPQDVRRRPGWDHVSAVRRGAVVTVDKDVASRWGPRLPRFVETVAEALETARSPVGQQP